MTHILKMLIAILVMLYANTIFAGNTNDIINRERLHSDKIIKEVLENKKSFTNYQKISIQKMPYYQEMIKDIKSKQVDRLKTSKTQGDTKETKETKKAIVFVSFSMPELSLKQIIQDGAYYKVPVVVRGLYQNSFRKTIEKIFELVKESNKGGIAINPKWFREYDIKAVPAVVVSGVIEIKDRVKKSDVVYGNIPLKKALSIIAERGAASNIAKNILDRNGR